MHRPATVSAARVLLVHAPGADLLIGDFHLVSVDFLTLRDGHCWNVHFQEVWTADTCRSAKMSLNNHQKVDFTFFRDAPTGNDQQFAVDILVLFISERQTNRLRILRLQVHPGYSNQRYIVRESVCRVRRMGDDFLDGEVLYWRRANHFATLARLTILCCRDVVFADSNSDAERVRNERSDWVLLERIFTVGLLNFGHNAPPLRCNAR